MKDRPLISIITVNFHQEEVTCQMLDSMRRITYPNNEGDPNCERTKRGV